ncbi:MAG: hypothetical protein AAGK71_14540 [Pseudomonadota bacterium]
MDHIDSRHEALRISWSLFNGLRRDLQLKKLSQILGKSLEPCRQMRLPSCLEQLSIWREVLSFRLYMPMTDKMAMNFGTKAPPPKQCSLRGNITTHQIDRWQRTRDTEALVDLFPATRRKEHNSGGQTVCVALKRRSPLLSEHQPTKKPRRLHNSLGLLVRH